MARLVLQPVSTAFNNNGLIEAGAKRYFYQTGTTTKITVYDAEDEGSELTNPQIADAYGRFAPAFVAQNRYKVVLTTADDVTLQTIDPVETTAGITGVSSDTAPTLGGDLNTDGNAVFWSKGADVASASELLVLTDGNYFDVTGTTAITSIETTADAFGIGSVIKLHFDGALTLTHHATDLILPGGANITTAAGDEFEFTKYASGDWRCTGYALASGGPIIGGDLVDDTTPQLGGDLDLNGNGISFPGATVTDVTGADTEVVSGTAGTDGNLAQWNSDGDLVDGSKAAADVVTGPASSTDNTIPRFDSTTGKVLQTSGVTIDDNDDVSGIRNLELTATTFASQHGKIVKGGNPWLHDFEYGNNGTVTVIGQNLWFGDGAGNLTTGATATVTGHSSYNIGIGDQSLTAITTGNKNTGIGQAALTANTTGSRNVALGQEALLANTTASNNMAIGSLALAGTTTGVSNTAVGYRTLDGNTTGRDNIGIGTQTGQFIADGTTPNTTSDYCILIGGAAKVNADNDQNEIVIGYDATGNGSNTVTIGNSSNTANYFTGLFNTGTHASSPYNNTTGAGADVVVNSSGDLLRSTSSARFKRDVEPMEDTYADAILNLEPIWYRSKCKADNPAHSFWGLVAEDVAEIDPRFVKWGQPYREVEAQELVSAQDTDAAGNIIPAVYRSVVRSEPDWEADPVPDGVDYARMVVPLLSLVKRQQKAIEELERRLDALDSKQGAVRG